MATTADDPTVILSIARTPMGSMQGALADASATDLGAAAVKAAVERAGVSGEDIDRIYMGCVLPAGLGQAPARQAAIKAGLPKSVQATTVNKVCGSGMQTVIMGDEALTAGNANFIIAGGMESMTNAPYLLKKHRSGARIGHDTAYDHMFLDGLEDAYEEGRAMGSFAQCTADEYQLTREQMDNYAIESLSRAKAAIDSGGFKDEIAPVTIKSRAGETVVDTDEAPGRGRPDKIPQLKPAFSKEGTITAATSSSISDGAAAVVLTRESVASAKGLDPVARIVATAAHAGAGAVHRRPDRSDREGARQGRLEGLRSRSLGSERGLRLRRDVRDEGPRHPAREDQRSRRRDRARSPDRGQRDSDPRDARQRAEGQGAEAWRREPLHRRR
jgi:acetyl-CoA C-acetyltransferase